VFVNTGGKLDTISPADLEMEHLVRLTKGHLKAMCSNKSEMRKRSSAFFGMQNICENFDTETNIVHPAQRYKVVSAVDDEMALIQDVRKIRPFCIMCGRKIVFMKRCPSNLVKRISLEELNKMDCSKLNYRFTN